MNCTSVQGTAQVKCVLHSRNARDPSRNDQSMKEKAGNHRPPRGRCRAPSQGWRSSCADRDGGNARPTRWFMNETRISRRRDQPSLGLSPTFSEVKLHCELEQAGIASTEDPPEVGGAS